MECLVAEAVDEAAGHRDMLEDRCHSSGRKTPLGAQLLGNADSSFRPLYMLAGILLLS